MPDRFGIRAVLNVSARDPVGAQIDFGLHVIGEVRGGREPHRVARAAFIREHHPVRVNDRLRRPYVIVEVEYHARRDRRPGAIRE